MTNKTNQELLALVHELVVSANTVVRSYTHKPANFDFALSSLKKDAANMKAAILSMQILTASNACAMPINLGRLGRRVHRPGTAQDRVMRRVLISQSKEQIMDKKDRRMARQNKQHPPILDDNCQPLDWLEEEAQELKEFEKSRVIPNMQERDHEPE